MRNKLKGKYLNGHGVLHNIQNFIAKYCLSKSCPFFKKYLGDCTIKPASMIRNPMSNSGCFSSGDKQSGKQRNAVIADLGQYCSSMSENKQLLKGR